MVLQHRKKKRVIIFDLDGTLAESKQPLGKEMASLLCKLLSEHYVAIISGGSFAQFETQFLEPLGGNPALLEHLVLLPTTGATLYRFKNNAWHQEYEELLTEAEAALITQALHAACEKFALPLDTDYGPTIENRGTQVTLSPLGQHAPVSIKQSWDPKQHRREEIVAFLTPLLPHFTITIGGMTSIDITHAGIDKASGVRKVQEHLNITLEEMLFVGDALFEGGNDAPALTTGVDCRAVRSIQDTKNIIREFL